LIEGKGANGHLVRKIPAKRMWIAFLGGRGGCICPLGKERQRKGRHTTVPFPLGTTDVSLVVMKPS